MYQRIDDGNELRCHFCNNLISINEGKMYTNYQLVQLKLREMYHPKCQDCVLHFPRSIKDIIDMELIGKIKVYIREPINSINIRYMKRDIFD